MTRGRRETCELVCLIMLTTRLARATCHLWLKLEHFIDASLTELYPIFKLNNLTMVSAIEDALLHTQIINQIEAVRGFVDHNAMCTLTSILQAHFLEARVKALSPSALRPKDLL